MLLASCKKISFKCEGRRPIYRILSLVSFVRRPLLDPIIEENIKTET